MVLVLVLSVVLLRVSVNFVHWVTLLIEGFVMSVCLIVHLANFFLQILRL